MILSGDLGAIEFTELIDWQDCGMSILYAIHKTACFVTFTQLS